MDNCTKKEPAWSSPEHFAKQAKRDRIIERLVGAYFILGTIGAILWGLFG